MAFNRITIMGRICNDLGLKQTNSGVDVLSFTVAVDRSFQPKDGGDKLTDFFSVTCWRNTAAFVAKYFGKGRMILIDGSMQSRKYQDKDGNNRTVWEIQADRVDFADSKKGDTDHASIETLPAVEDEGDLPF